MSDEKPILPQEKARGATGESKASLAELIAQTPGAQTREQLLERIKARQQKRLKKQSSPAPAEEALVTPEPLPIVHQPDKFAADFFARLKEKTKATQKDNPKAKPTPKRSKPRLVVDNDKPDPADKK